MWEFIKYFISEYKIQTIIVIVLLILFGWVGIATSTNHHAVVATITEKERVVDGDSSKYLIFTKTQDGDVLVLQNTDSFINAKFNSSDLYAKLEVGKTYTFDLVGYRVQFFSWYENIVNATEVG